MVLERGCRVAGAVGLCHPELHTVHLTAVTRGLLGVRDPASGGHQVELAGADHLDRSETVAVQQFARHQPGDRLQPDVRVRTDSEASSGLDAVRPDVVGETPCTHGAPRAHRKCSSHALATHGRSVTVAEFDLHHGPASDGVQPVARSALPVLISRRDPQRIELPEGTQATDEPPVIDQVDRHHIHGGLRAVRERRGDGELIGHLVATGA